MLAVGQFIEAAHSKGSRLEGQRESQSSERRRLEELSLVTKLEPELLF